MMEIADSDTLLETLCSLPTETDWVEFKENKFNADTVGQYVSAIANSAIYHGKDHGYLVYGVEDATHQIVGTNVNFDQRKVGNDNFLFWLSRLLDPVISVQHHKFLYKGSKSIEILCIDPGNQRPVRFKGLAYIRVGASQQQLGSHPEIERAIWNITSKYSFELMKIRSNVLADDVIGEYDGDLLLKLLKKTVLGTGPSLSTLTDMGLIEANLQGRYDIRALYALCCAKDMDKLPLISGKAVRVTTYKSTSKLAAVSDYEGRRGYTVTFAALMKYVMERIPHNEVMKHGIRVVVHEIPELAIREFLANAIIHQDLTVTGRPTVEIYADKIRIINPGTPLVEPDRFIDTPSKSRNPRFARLMRDAGLCEERGSGVDRALSEIEKASLPPPLIQTVEGSTIITIFTRRPFTALSAEDRVRACYQHACLRYEAGNYMSNMTLRERFGLSQKQYSQVSVVIRDAIDAGRVRALNADQPNRVAQYVPYWA